MVEQHELYRWKTGPGNPTEHESWLQWVEAGICLESAFQSHHSSHTNVIVMFGSGQLPAEELARLDAEVAELTERFDVLHAQTVDDHSDVARVAIDELRRLSAERQKLRTRREKLASLGGQVEVTRDQWTTIRRAGLVGVLKTLDDVKAVLDQLARIDADDEVVHLSDLKAAVSPVLPAPPTEGQGRVSGDAVRDMYDDAGVHKLIDVPAAGVARQA